MIPMNEGDVDSSARLPGRLDWPFLDSTLLPWATQSWQSLSSSFLTDDPAGDPAGLVPRGGDSGGLLNAVSRYLLLPQDREGDLPPTVGSDRSHPRP